jgi:hypothetical protein
MNKFSGERENIWMLGTEEKRTKIFPCNAMGPRALGVSSTLAPRSMAVFRALL